MNTTDNVQTVTRYGNLIVVEYEGKPLIFLSLSEAQRLTEMLTRAVGTVNRGRQHISESSGLGDIAGTPDEQ